MKTANNWKCLGNIDAALLMFAIGWSVYARESTAETTSEKNAL